MTLTAVSVLRIHRPRAFHALAAAVLLLGSCGSGEGESPPDEAAAPIEHAEGGGAVAEAPAGGESGPEGDEDLSVDPATPAPAGPADAGDAGPGAAGAGGTNGHHAGGPEVDGPAGAAVVPAVAPSPPPRPSPVADAPPPPPPEPAPLLSTEEVIERASRPPVGDEVRSLVACGDVAEAYRGLMAKNRSCTRDADCQVIEGACAIGLGGCWYAVNRSVGYDDADRLATRYRELACGGPVCRCAAPPERAVCDEGVCTAS